MAPVTMQTYMQYIHYALTFSNIFFKVLDFEEISNSILLALATSKLFAKSRSEFSYSA